LFINVSAVVSSDERNTLGGTLVMKVVVGHHLWSRVGGGELVSAYAVKSLVSGGHEVAIASTVGFGKEKYREWFGIDMGDVRVYSLVPGMLPMFGIYQRLAFFIPLGRAIRSERPDTVFVDNELYKPIIKLKRSAGFRLVEYIHFPFHAVRFSKGDIPEGYMEVYKKYATDILGYHAKYRRGLWKLYFRLWLKLYGRLARDDPFGSADIVLVNSNYIARLTKMLWDGEPVVVNPPVMVSDFAPRNSKGFGGREDAVVMIGRITPEKRIEDVIDAISLSETRPRLRVVGGLIPSGVPYLNYLRKRARKKGVEVEFHVNAPREELVQVATSSKVFVHATRGEHFGIAVVEGMASGCPVIVHKSGGPYEDITDYGRYGLYYGTLGELSESIDSLMSDPRKWAYYHELSLRRAPEYSEERFSARLLEVIVG